MIQPKVGQKFRIKPYPFAETIESPVVISAGTMLDGGDTLSYWIECNSGWLFSYNARLDAIIQICRLYVGDGKRTTGIEYAKYLKPVLSHSMIWFSLPDGYVYEYSFATDLVRQIHTTPQWIRWM
jgi:hypothetical protein